MCLCEAFFFFAVQNLTHFVNLTVSFVADVTSSTLTWVSSWQVTFLFVALCKEVLNLIVKTRQWVQAQSLFTSARFLAYFHSFSLKEHCGEENGQCKCWMVLQHAMFLSSTT